MLEFKGPNPSKIVLFQTNFRAIQRCLFLNQERNDSSSNDLKTQTIFQREIRYFIHIVGHKEPVLEVLMNPNIPRSPVCLKLRN